MSKPVIISSDSTCDLSPELRSRYQIQIVPLTITLGESSFLDGESFTPDDMYARFRKDGTLPKTSAPSVQNFLDFFQSYVDQGYEIVHFDISAELSGSYNAARLAADELTGVYVIDSTMLSTGIGLLAIEAAECRDRGMQVSVRRCFMKLAGLQKLTLLDYPGQLACTVFTSGCNMRCPFCQNADLVLP
jgi:DegV family protein with EDD domain